MPVPKKTYGKAYHAAAARKSYYKKNPGAIPLSAINAPGEAGLPKRFWDRVKKTSTCWLWHGSTVRGYGVISFDRINKPAHRICYEAFHNVKVPAGLHMDHLCRVKNCVNPKHLEPVTPLVNTMRGIGPAKINSMKTHCPSGHAYDEANTCYKKNKRRSCRACSRDYMRRRKEQEQK